MFFWDINRDIFLFIKDKLKVETTNDIPNVLNKNQFIKIVDDLLNELHTKVL
jgi:hypothetical protein